MRRGWTGLVLESHRNVTSSEEMRYGIQLFLRSDLKLRQLRNAQRSRSIVLLGSCLNLRARRKEIPMVPRS
jgi:hypothetical protein